MSSEHDLLNDLNNIDLSTVSTALPILDPGLYEVQVASAVAKPNKAGTGSNLELKFVLTQPAKGRAGDSEVDIQPGFPIFHMISLVQTEKYDPRRNLAVFMEATLGTKTGNFMPLEQYIGQTLMVRTSVDTKNVEQFGPRVRVDKMLRKS